MRYRSALMMIVCCAAMAVGCSDEQIETQSAADSEADEVVILEGKQPKLPTDKVPAKKPKKDTEDQDSAEEVVELPEIPKLADGTIDDGPDPFANRGPIPPQPLPVERDSDVTLAVDAAAWPELDDDLPQNTPATGVVQSTVKIYTFRCGGAVSTAAGVVVGEELVMTTATAVESIGRRVRVQSGVGNEPPRIPAQVFYLDIDDDIAILRVPGLTLQAPTFFEGVSLAAAAEGSAFGFRNGRGLDMSNTVVGAGLASLTVDEFDAFGLRISDRDVIPFVGPVGAGYLGSPIYLAVDGELQFFAMTRARVQGRRLTAGIAVPLSHIDAAIAAAGALDENFEHAPGGCPQWHR